MQAMKLENSSVLSSVSDALGQGAQENDFISPSRQNQQDDWLISYGPKDRSTDMLLSSEIISSAKTAGAKDNVKIENETSRNRPGVFIVTLAITRWFYNIFYKQIEKQSGLSVGVFPALTPPS